jgi:CsoR family transcriptional regulator, copper-sensing transcriptional repressor
VTVPPAQAAHDDRADHRPLRPGRGALTGDGGLSAAADGERPRCGYASGETDYLSRLAKIEGQVRGLQKMVDADTYCPYVVVQVASVTRARQEVAVGLLTDHLDRCVVNAARASVVGGQASLGEVASTIRQVIRL